MSVGRWWIRSSGWCGDGASGHDKRAPLLNPSRMRAIRRPKGHVHSKRPRAPATTLYSGAAPMASSSDSAAGALSLNERVILHGLQRKALNGALGTVIGPPVENGRVPVHVDPPHDIKILLKPENLDPEWPLSLSDKDTMKLRFRVGNKVLCTDNDLDDTEWFPGTI